MCLIFLGKAQKGDSFGGLLGSTSGSQKGRFVGPQRVVAFSCPYLLCRLVTDLLCSMSVGIFTGFSEFSSSVSISPDHEMNTIIGVFWGIEDLDTSGLDVYKPDDFKGKGGVRLSQERKGHINLRKSPGHRPGVLGLPAGQTGVYRSVSQGFPVYYSRKTDKKGPFCRGHPAIQGFSEILCVFFLGAFSAPCFRESYTAATVTPHRNASPKCCNMAPCEVSRQEVVACFSDHG